MKLWRGWRVSKRSRSVTRVGTLALCQQPQINTIQICRQATQPNELLARPSYLLSIQRRRSVANDPFLAIRFPAGDRRRT